jgi:hypothetical protein
MLTNELEASWYLPDNSADGESLEAAYQRIAGAWAQATFSDTPDHSLKRYFNFHLQGISKISDTLFTDQSLLLRLIDCLLDHFGRYIELDCPAPMAYRRRLAARLAATNLPGLPFVTAYIREVTDIAYTFSFRALRYLETLVTALSSGHNPGTVLLELNFNHLGYLAQLQEDICLRLQPLANADKRHLLWTEKARIAAVPEYTGPGYHPDWPALKTMLLTWLGEQLALLPPSMGLKKLPLNLSVAQLACLVRLCYEEDFFKETNLTALFDFIAATYTTKKQDTISPGSLSKNYYSTDQVTAALMRDKLLKMAARLTRQFFPV